MERVPLMGHGEFMAWCWNQDRDKQHFTLCLWKQLCFQKGYYAEGHVFASHQDSSTIQNAILFLKLVANADCPADCGIAAIKISTSVPVLETFFSLISKSLNDVA